MTPEMKISIFLGLLSFIAAVLTPILLSRTQSQRRNDDSLTLKTYTETVKEVMEQNKKLIENNNTLIDQNNAIIQRLSGTGRLSVDFDMDTLVETGKTSIKFGTIEILKVPAQVNR